MDLDDHRFLAYELAKTDHQAAQMLALKHTTFWAWRKRHDLPAPSRLHDDQDYTGHPVPADEHAHRFFAYEVCHSDRMAARLVGLSHGGYTHWRWRQDLPPITSAKKGWPPNLRERLEVDA